MNGLASNLLLTIPLVVFVVVGLFAWDRMEAWIQSALELGDQEEDARDAFREVIR